MKTYKNTTVKYWTDVWDDVKSFDILTTENVAQRFFSVYEKIDEFVDNLPDKAEHFQDSNGKFTDKNHHKLRIKMINHTKSGSPVNISKLHHQWDPNGKVLYLEIPYQFYLDYMTDWQDNGNHISWTEAKTKILSGENWKGRLQGASTALAYIYWETFRDYGVGNPVYNNGENYPKRSTHITAYTHLNKSDVPILFTIPSMHYNPHQWIIEKTKFKVKPNKEEPPYFRNSYISLEIDIDNKLVDFFLEDEHIGVYKG